MTHRRLFSRLLAMATWLTLSVALAGCGNRMSGTYVAADMPAGAMTLEFKSGDKAVFTVLGETREVKYTVEGDKVIMHHPDGNQVYTIESDGRLTTDALLGRTLTKK